MQGYEWEQCLGTHEGERTRTRLLTCDGLLELLEKKANSAVDAGGEVSRHAAVSAPIFTEIAHSILTLSVDQWTERWVRELKLRHGQECTVKI